jgi:hypothetical protein
MNIYFKRLACHPKPKAKDGGDTETRTPDILLAKQALYQLSYIPINL